MMCIVILYQVGICTVNCVTDTVRSGQLHDSILSVYFRISAGRLFYQILYDVLFYICLFYNDLI